MKGNNGHQDGTNIMTFKRLHHSKLVNIGYPFGYVNWGICVFNLIRILAQPDHPLNGQNPAPILLPRRELMVPRGRVELPLSYENRILSPARLPVPPSGHILQQANLLSTKPCAGQSAPLFS